MGIGDEIGLSEDLYQQLIGRYVVAIEVLTKRLVAKDQHISRLETQLAVAETKVAKQEGEVYFGDEPPKD